MTAGSCHQSLGWHKEPPCRILSQDWDRGDSPGSVRVAGDTGDSGRCPQPLGHPTPPQSPHGSGSAGTSRGRAGAAAPADPKVTLGTPRPPTAGSGDSARLERGQPALQHRVDRGPAATGGIKLQDPTAGQGCWQDTPAGPAGDTRRTRPCATQQRDNQNGDGDKHLGCLELGCAAPLSEI